MSATPGPKRSLGGINFTWFPNGTILVLELTGPDQGWGRLGAHDAYGHNRSKVCRFPVQSLSHKYTGSAKVAQLRTHAR
jgi:hypothetical protein